MWAVALGAEVLTGIPATVTLPPSAESNPHTSRMVVVFPAPLGPSRP
jgi:hypothetical protein